MSNTDQFRDLIEAYALGALDAEERAAVESHLVTGCAGCSAALDEARWLVSQLAYLAPEAEPSDMLRGRVLRKASAEASAFRPESRVRSGPVVPLWMWGAVAAAVLFGLYNAYDTARQRAIVSDLQKQIAQEIQQQQQQQQELALAHREALILTDSRSMKITMPPGRKDLPSLHATWHAALGIVVSGQKLPVPSGRRTLQLWLIPKTPGARPVPSLFVRPAPDGTFDLLVENPPESQGAIKALAITEEPEGGSPQPTTTPIWVGAVTGK